MAHSDWPVAPDVSVRNLHDLPLFVHEVRRLAAVGRCEHERKRFFRAQIQLVFALKEQVLVVALKHEINHRS